MLDTQLLMSLLPEEWKCELDTERISCKLWAFSTGEVEDMNSNTEYIHLDGELESPWFIFWLKRKLVCDFFECQVLTYSTVEYRDLIHSYSIYEGRIGAFRTNAKASYHGDWHPTETLALVNAWLYLHKTYAENNI